MSAFLLMCFTKLLGVVYLGIAFSEAFKCEVGRPDVVDYLSNFM